MHNEILTIGPLTIHGYGLMIAIGVLCAFLLASKRAKDKGLDDNIIINLGFIAVVSGFIGAKILYCIVELDTFLTNPSIVIASDGFVVYGGIIGGILASLVYCHKNNIKFLEYFDIAAPSIAIAQGFGRIGCFLAGCCYGKETDSIIGIVFHNSELAPNGVSLFPTQLISSGGNFLIALILIMYAKKNRSYGKVGGLYLILNSVGRFIIEFYRNDFRGTIGFLSTSQFISIIMLLLGIVIFMAAKIPLFNKSK